MRVPLVICATPRLAAPPLSARPPAQCYHAEDAAVYLAAPDFLSWDMMGADLYQNIEAGIDPLALKA